MQLHYALLFLLAAAAPVTAEVRGEKHDAVNVMPHVEEQTLRAVKPHTRDGGGDVLLGAGPRGVGGGRGSKPPEKVHKPVQGRMGHTTAV